MIRVGILGCANIAQRSLAPAFATSDKFKIMAFGSRSIQKAAEIAIGYAALPCTYDDLINSKDIDLVYCPLPTGLHYEWVKRALYAGKHVLCEKSLACNFRDAAELVDIAMRNDLFLMENFQFRFHPQNLWVKDLLANNSIGSICSIDVRFGFPPFANGMANIRYSKKLGGGALFDAGAYTIKASTFLLGDNLEMIMAKSCCHDGYEVDIDGRLWLERSDGVVSTTAYGFHNYYQCGYDIWGEVGRISTTRAFTARNDFAAEVVCETINGRILRTFKADHFALMLEYVHQCLEEKRYENEYRECLNQARLIDKAKRIMNL